MKHKNENYKLSEKIKSFRDKNFEEKYKFLYNFRYIA